MNLVTLVKSASRLYARAAYPDGPPGPVSRMLDELQSFVTSDALLSWSALEREDSRYSLRLGNQAYPHMKIVFSLESERPSFYVDAHDNHFDLPPGVPGHEKLIELRESNKMLKTRIENDWAREQIPVFGIEKVKPGLEPKLRKELMGLRVLAVDDEAQILDMLKLIVGALGAELDAAASAAEARRLIEANGLPDLIFCDIMMPEESGYDFTAWLEANGHEVPVYFITGYALDQVVESDVVEVLQKPFTAKSIMKIMKKVHDQRL